ncbi:DUF397 domain-containing protein [Actinomadura harenae]|uniref:DUF397 domain-containing protein n=1 Tax=Actinomadura harenae TaxID=2483351 RepID=A0A3M2M4I9_9ACTN|nr:DUF397 domain-containing protein [Actinomadura harenae]RMI44684.1 DUF397 domain-containing protein [Actinomadura harenae]
MIKWRKSSHSSESGGGGTCIELADLGTFVGVRDSKDPDAGHLTLHRTDLRRLASFVLDSEPPSRARSSHAPG